MKDTFHFIQEPYNWRNNPELQRRRTRTVYFGTESIFSLAKIFSQALLKTQIHWENLKKN